MSFLTEIETRLKGWKGKREAKKTLASLVDSIANINLLLETSNSSYRSSAIQHSDSADRDYHAAIRAFKADNFARCNEFMERAKLHLEIAHMQIINAGQTDWELHFDEDSAESIVAHLAQSVTSAKLAIEYSNCMLRQQVKNALVTVTKFFQQAAGSLLDNDSNRARRTAYGGLLYLHCVSLQLAVDNQRTIFEIYVPHCDRLEKSVLALAEQLAKCQQMFVSAGMSIPKAARSHFAEAENTLCDAIDNIVAGKTHEADSAISAASMQVKLAEKLFHVSEGSKPKESAPVPTMPESIEFRLVVNQLLPVLKDMKVRKPDAAEKSLKTAVAYYESACSSFSRLDFAEADRLARLAYVEVDSAKKCAWYLNI